MLFKLKILLLAGWREDRVGDDRSMCSPVLKAVCMSQMMPAAGSTASVIMEINLTIPG